MIIKMIVLLALLTSFFNSVDTQNQNDYEHLKNINQSTPNEIYELGLAYYESDSVTEDDGKDFK
ncbi:hypothetical protein ACTXJ5_08720 [Psychrobacter alimentarius]|uniref:hypothetical protein n=1 Tax=Psychrobacter alimentarius TaxID=261164 RepID=UPI003FD3BB2F